VVGGERGRERERGSYANDKRAKRLEKEIAKAAAVKGERERLGFGVGRREEKRRGKRRRGFWMVG
jgi:hypothetical protein